MGTVLATMLNLRWPHSIRLAQVVGGGWRC
jgi:hypothetical protein